jgi:hypothetical protein
MENGSIESVVEEQRQTIKLLQEQMMAITARLPEPVADAPQPGKFLEFPRVVYRAHKKAKPGQIDHPGQDSKVVNGPAALEAAIAEGWSVEPLPYAYPDPDEAPAAKAAPQKGGKK